MMWLANPRHHLVLHRIHQLQEKFIRSIKIGIIPLGKENNFFKQCFPGQTEKLPARSAGNIVKKNEVFFCRMIGEAARTVIEGSSFSVSVMQFRSEEGNPIYALKKASWGIFKDAYKKKDRLIMFFMKHLTCTTCSNSFRLFGPLRTLASHIYMAFKVIPSCVLSHVRYISRPGQMTIN